MIKTRQLFVDPSIRIEYEAMRFPGFSVYHETPFTCQVILREQNFARSRDCSPAASTDKDKQGKGKHTFRATRLEEIKASDVRAINLGSILTEKEKSVPFFGRSFLYAKREW